MGVFACETKRALVHTRSYPPHDDEYDVGGIKMR